MLHFVREACTRDVSFRIRDVPSRFRYVASRGRDVAEYSKLLFAHKPDYCCLLFWVLGGGKLLTGQAVAGG
jgi:hypothetical protein